MTAKISDCKKRKINQVISVEGVKGWDGDERT